MKPLISYLLISVIAIALGVIPAYLYHRYETNTIDEEFFSDQWSQAGDNKIGPVLRCIGSPVHDFGKIDAKKKYTHEFIIENKGDQTLEIWSEPVVESIVKTDLGQEPVLIVAGATYPIGVGFDGKDIKSDLSESVIIKSNDPAQANGEYVLKVIAARQ